VENNRQRAEDEKLVAVRRDGRCRRWGGEKLENGYWLLALRSQRLALGWA
jgi:hypothetical protein